MATLLSRSAWAKISVFRKKWPFSPSKLIISDFLARIRNQRLRIDPCPKFQLHWTNNKGTQILTWNDTKTGLITSYLPPGDDVSKIFMDFERLSQSTIILSLAVIGPQIKGNNGGHNVPPCLYSSKRPQPE